MSRSTSRASGAASESVNRPQSFNRVICVGFSKPLPTDASEKQIRGDLQALGTDIWNLAMDHSESIIPLWFKAMRKRRSRVILIDPAGSHVSGYGMIRLCHYFGKKIKSVARNDRNVGFMLPTSRDAALGIISILGTGQTSVNLNYSAPVDTILGCIEKADLTTVVTTHAFFDKLCGRNAAVGQIAGKCAMIYLDEEEAKISTLDRILSTFTVIATPKAILRRLWFTSARLDDDAVIDIRWMRDGREGMATDSSRLPEGWRLERDFDMQAECQRLVDAAVADQLSPGVQFCAYKDGKCIVNVFAGKLTKAPDSPSVQVDSLFPIFSTEKPLLSTACHRAVERGLMDYDKPLCTWWPELDERGFFAKLFDLDSDTKKERLTLRETLGYRTSMPGGAPGGRGNPVCDHMLSDRELCDWDFVCKVAAADRPNGVPGTVQAYLPYAYAWMIGHPLEVAMGKPLNDVLTEEVLIPSGIEKEFYFVVPRSEYPRVAEYYDGGFCENMNYDWARQALLPSAWGVSSAQALCKFYNRLCGFDGKEPLIKKETLDAALKPCRHPSDPLPNAKSMKRDWFMLFGMGYGLWGSAERMDRVFGHGGAGGSEALVDRDHKLIVGYTCNSCKNSIVLRDKLYEVVGMRWRYWNDNVNIQDLQMSTSGGGNYGAGITSQP